MGKLAHRKAAMSLSSLPRFRRLVCSASLALATLFNAGMAQANTSEFQLNEEIVMLPVTENGERLQLETTIFRPPGNGPFPLLLMNHGKDRGNPTNQKRDRFLAMSREFVKRGYAVAVPMRKGFAKSSGQYSDFGCNMKDNGQLQADDVQAALTALVKENWVDPDRILVAGQSYGGLATMAFGTRPFPGVRGMLNFAGGLRVDGGNCQWREALVSAVTDYAAKTTLPSLWFYGENDSYFNPELARQMFHAYQSAGGQAQLIAFGKFKADAHGLAGSRDGVAIWWPETERFLQSVGLPTAVVVPLAPPPKMAASNFAPIDNISAVPYLTENGREGYRSFLEKATPRAFAVSASGQWSWAEEGDDPAERVLATCQQSSKTPCRLYAVDQDVVWSKQAPGTTATASATSRPGPLNQASGQ